MCLALAPLLSAVGTAVSAVGSIAQGNAANAAAQAQAQAMEQQAEAERRSAAFEASQELRKQDLALSNARAQVGASGVSFAGSPTAVLTANAGQGQLDLEAIRYGSTLKQNTLMTQADITRSEGKSARTAGFIGAASKAVRFGQSVFK